MVRLGIGLYGLYPSQEVNRSRVKLEPVLSLKSKVVFVKRAPEGWGISYGTRYFAGENEIIGTLPIGYADGFSRLLTGKAHALIDGVKRPIVGTICMDQCMVSLGEAAAGTGEIEAGAEAVLIGQQGEAFITAEEVAEQLGSIPYELICMLAARVPRIYIENGTVVRVTNPLEF
jgi:alanine racemase